MKILKISKMILLSIGMILVVSYAHAAVYEVYGQSGDTIQGAIDGAVSGDTIRVYSGTYYENIIIKQGVRLCGEGSVWVTIAGVGNFPDSGNPTVTMRQGSSIAGFRITGGFTGISSDSVTADIMNNVVTGNYGVGISLVARADGSVVNSRVINNTVVNNLDDEGGFSVGIYGETHGDSTGVNPIIMNNIVTGHRFGIAFYNYTGATNPQITYNDVWGNTTANYGYSYSPDSTNIEADPGYADSDFQLSAGVSPCINAGNPDSQYRDPNGSQNDMGAYGGPGPCNDPIACNLAAHYPFDGDALDATGSGNDGTVHGNMILVPDRNGNPNSAYYFDGIDDRISMPSGDFTSGNNISFTAWIKFDEQPTSPSGVQHFIRSHEFFVSQRIDSDVEIAFPIPRQESQSTNSAYGNVPVYGEWFHFTGTYDGTNIRAYINGVLAGQTSWPGSLMEQPVGFTLGYVYSYWKGYLDDVRVYECTLNESEIQAIMNDVVDPCDGQGGDADEDGICGDSDNCPTVSNDDQTNTDGDNLGDACDTDDDNDGVVDGADPQTLDPDVCGDSDEDNCDDCAIGTDDLGPLPDNDTASDGPDFDEDGICDVGDNCLKVKNPNQENSDIGADGLPLPDSFGDACDHCPGVYNTDEDNDGYADKCTNDNAFDVGNETITDISRNSEEFLVTYTFEYKGALSAYGVPPDCDNTFTICEKDGLILQHPCRRRAPYKLTVATEHDDSDDPTKYGRPGGDWIEFVPGQTYTTTPCNLYDIYNKEDLLGTVKCYGVFDHFFTDPDKDPVTGGCLGDACIDEETYPVLQGAFVTGEVSSTMLEVQIDIKPGRFPNSINPGSNGNIPIAILSQPVSDSIPAFDATTVNPSTITFADVGKVRLVGKWNKQQAATEDVNSDGLMDMIVHIDMEGLSKTLHGAIEATLDGQTHDGTYFSGSDSVRIVGPKK